MTRPAQPSANLESLAAQCTENRTGIDELRTSMTEMEQRLDMKFEAILRKLDKRPAEEASPQSDPIIPLNKSQVPISNSEPGRSSRNHDDRTLIPLVENRERMIKRVELPIFNGDDAYGWIALAERFFRIGGYGELMKIEVSATKLKFGNFCQWLSRCKSVLVVSV